MYTYPLNKKICVGPKLIRLLIKHHTFQKKKSYIIKAGNAKNTPLGLLIPLVLIIRMG